MIVLGFIALGIGGGVLLGFLTSSRKPVTPPQLPKAVAKYRWRHTERVSQLPQYQ